MKEKRERVRERVRERGRERIKAHIVLRSVTHFCPSIAEPEPMGRSSTMTDGEIVCYDRHAGMHANAHTCT